MNSDETWLLYLFSGVFASAVGGGVAILVLWRTNAHQAKLSRKQLDEQRNQAQLGRRIDALAEVSGILKSMVMKRDAGFQQLADLSTEGTSAIMHWRLNNGDTGVAEALERIVGDMASANMYYAGHPTPGGNLPGALRNVGVTIHDLNRLVVDLATEKETAASVADGLQALSADFRQALRKEGVTGYATDSTSQ